MSAAVARAIRQAFASYRTNMDVARNPEEGAQIRGIAWSRASKARARMERHIDSLESAR